jgi:hypothetical protein
MEPPMGNGHRHPDLENPVGERGQLPNFPLHRGGLWFAQNAGGIDDLECGFPSEPVRARQRSGRPVPEAAAGRFHGTGHGIGLQL